MIASAAALDVPGPIAEDSRKSASGPRYWLGSARRGWSVLAFRAGYTVP